MVMTSRKDMISSEEVRIMLLEQKNDDFHQALIRIEKKFDQIDVRFDKMENRFDQIDKRFEMLERKMENRFNSLESRVEKLDTRIDSNFKWILAFILPSFLGILGLMAHGFKWV